MHKLDKIHCVKMDTYASWCTSNCASQQSPSMLDSPCLRPWSSPLLLVASLPPVDPLGPPPSTSVAAAGGGSCGMVTQLRDDWWWADVSSLNNSRTAIVAYVDDGRVNSRTRAWWWETARVENLVSYNCHIDQWHSSTYTMPMCCEV